MVEPPMIAVVPQVAMTQRGVGHAGAVDGQRRARHCPTRAIAARAGC